MFNPDTERAVKMSLVKAPPSIPDLSPTSLKRPHNKRLRTKASKILRDTKTTPNIKVVAAKIHAQISTNNPETVAFTEDLEEDEL